jgi:hypothetical protein
MANTTVESLDVNRCGRWDFDSIREWDDYWVEADTGVVDLLMLLWTVFDDICENGACLIIPVICDDCEQQATSDFYRECCKCAESLPCLCYDCDWDTMESFKCQGCLSNAIHVRCTPEGVWSEEGFDEWKCGDCIKKVSKDG